MGGPEALQYDLDALYRNIAKIDENIALFEQAIADERIQKKRLWGMIEVLEARKREQTRGDT